MNGFVRLPQPPSASPPPSASSSSPPPLGFSDLRSRFEHLATGPAKELPRTPSAKTSFISNGLRPASPAHRAPECSGSSRSSPRWNGGHGTLPTTPSATQGNLSRSQDPFQGAASEDPLLVASADSSGSEAQAALRQDIAAKKPPPPRPPKPTFQIPVPAATDATPAPGPSLQLSPPHRSFSNLRSRFELAQPIVDSIASPPEEPLIDPRVPPPPLPDSHHPHEKSGGGSDAGREETKENLRAVAAALDWAATPVEASTSADAGLRPAPGGPRGSSPAPSDVLDVASPPSSVAASVPPRLPSRPSTDKSLPGSSNLLPPPRRGEKTAQSRAVSSPVGAPKQTPEPSSRGTRSSPAPPTSPPVRHSQQRGVSFGSIPSPPSSSAPALRAAKPVSVPFAAQNSHSGARPPPPPSRAAHLSQPPLLRTSGSQRRAAPPLSSRPSQRHLENSSSSESEDEVAFSPPSAPTGLAHSAPEEEPTRKDSLHRGLSRIHGSNGILLPSETLPDASRANRRPPCFSPPRHVQSKHFHCFAVSGHTVCTASGDKVRVYRVGPTARSTEGEKLCSLAAEHGGKEVKIITMAFKPAAAGEHEGRYLWCGTREGTLCELDIAEATISSSKHSLHTAAIVLVERFGQSMLTMDESGKMCVWPPQDEARTLSLSQSPITRRVTLDKATVIIPLEGQLWACSGHGTPASASGHGHPTRLSHKTSLRSHLPASASAKVAAATGGGSAPRGPHKVRIFNPFSTTASFNATSRPVGIGDLGSHLAPISCGTIVPQDPGKVYLGHESGHVSVWDRTNMTCTGVQRLGILGFTALCGVGKHLWTGNRSGRITIFVPGTSDEEPWHVLKSWPAHKAPVNSICVDPTALDPEYADDGVAHLQVVSAGSDHSVQIWDGLLSSDWLANRLSLRSAEYSAYRQIRCLHVSFNIDAASPADLQSSVESLEWLPRVLASASQVDEAGKQPDLIYFGFQEVVDLEDKRLTAKSMLLNATGGKRAKADMSERISHQYKLWYDRIVQSIRLAMPADTPYRVVYSESLVGLFSCLLVRADEFASVTDAALTTVKTGLGGRWGNKGAIVTRFTFDDTSCCFINAHLAAGQKHLKQRNDDLAQIMESESLPEGTSDEAIFVGGGSGELILDHELVFLGGDLNYRIDVPRSQAILLISQNQLDTLYERDQLHNELMRGAPTFRLRGFCEAGPLTFPPTYKFDRGSQEYDSSEKKRIPAWCDRLLYRAAVVGKPAGSTSEPEPTVRCVSYRSWPEITVSDHRPVSAVYELRVKRMDRALREDVRAEEAVRGEERRVEMLRKASEYYGALGAADAPR